MNRRGRRGVAASACAVVVAGAACLTIAWAASTAPGAADAVAPVAPTPAADAAARVAPAPAVDAPPGTAKKPAVPAPPPRVEFSADDIAAILALGPPPSPPRDPTNRVSGQPAAIAFGARLFSDIALSSTGTVSCATCHDPGRAFTDGEARAHGEGPGDRNTPTLLGVAGQRWFGWDGGNDNLWAQSLRPLLDKQEMGASLAHIAKRVRSDPVSRAQYVAAFGRPPPADDEIVAVDAAKAIAAYLETLPFPRSRFDDFREALARGDRDAFSRYPALAQRGLQIFVGSGRCTLCHGGPRLSHGEFSDVGVPFFVAPGRVDPGRHGGIEKLVASRYNLLGPFNDDPARATATSTRHVAAAHRNFGEFRVPSLRNVANTAPYMHDGSLPTLRAVVRHYSTLDENRLHADGERILQPLDLDKYDVDALVAFLETLSPPLPGGK